jgi:hypothetical protein
MPFLCLLLFVLLFLWMFIFEVTLQLVFELIVFLTVFKWAVVSFIGFFFSLDGQLLHFLLLLRLKVKGTACFVFLAHPEGLP